MIIIVGFRTNLAKSIYKLSNLEDLFQVQQGLDPYSGHTDACNTGSTCGPSRGISTSRSASNQAILKGCWRQGPGLSTQEARGFPCWS